MARKPDEAGSEFLKGVLALIPEDKRKGVEEVLGGKELVEKIGSGLVEHETKAEQAIAEAAKKEQLTLGYKANLDKWYTDTQATFAATRKELEDKAKTQTPPAGDGNPPPAVNFLTKEDFSKQAADMLAASERGAVGAMAFFTQLGLSHLNEFKEVLNVQKLLADAAAVGKTVPVFYEEFVKPKRQEAFAASQKKREDEIRKDEREKLQAELSKKSGHGAYPLHGFAAEEPPTTLAGLKSGNGKDAAPEYGVQAALNEFFSKGQNI